MKTRILTLLLVLIVTNLFAQFPTNGIVVQYGFDNNLSDGVNGASLNHSGTNQTFVNDRFGGTNSSINFVGDTYTTNAISYGTNDEADTTVSFWIKTNTDSTDEKMIVNRLAGVGYRINLVAGKIKVLARYEYTFYNGLKRVEGHDAISEAKINDDEWHLITVQVWKRSDNIGTSKGVDYFTRIYIDTKLDTTLKRNRRPNTFLNRQLNVTRGHTTNQITNIAKASNANPINQYQDNLDDLLVYNRLLTTTEIASIANYNNFCTPIVAENLTVSNITASNITLTNNSTVVVDVQYAVVSDPANAQMVTNVQPGASFNIDASTFSSTPASYEVRARKNCGSNNVSSWSFPLIVKNSGVPTYVDLDATGDNDGSSWINAYSNLQDAITNARDNEEIWVAGGTYHPHVTSRNTYFNITQENFKIYGGFAGTETQLSDRVLGMNETILSGDLQENDVNTTDLISNYANTTRNADNSYHVVNITNTGENLLLDGLTISDAHNNLNATERGGAIVKHKNIAKLTLRNCTVKDNVSRNDNAGLVAEFELYLIIAGVNAGQINGGSGFLTIENCKFTNNMSRWASGVYCFVRDYTKIDVTITNSLFDANIAGDLNTTTAKGLSGPAAWLRNIGGSTSELDIKINNTTFVNNKGTGTSQSLNNFNRATLVLAKGTTSIGSTTAVVSNSIFWNNTSGGGATSRSITDQYTSPLNNLSVVNSIGQANFNDDSITSKTNTSNTDPLFTNTLNGDYALSLGSPAIDTGDNTKIIGTTDLLGNSRVFNTNVDMGAYEFGSTTLSNNVVLSDTDTLMVYPNPVSDVLYITEKVKSLQLYNSNGQLVVQTREQQLNVNPLPAGIYVAKIITFNGRIISKKIIKK